ncbi:unnamed protein product [Cylindrotheca closterium]|uniref:Trafficking protein particle complex subunit 11 domain-containing protein n=1 Tax=Cylindrotheca closterium TaxID=2856 RepID=A0AAD2FBX3_9STRA|nr:unnamed protein product [Cylindrotheca closterium]
METYPGEILVGVFPLVFCVDATFDNAVGTPKGSSTKPPQSRSQFDRFLDAMASSLMDDSVGDHPLGSTGSATASKDVLNALLRNQSADDSDDDEALLSHTVPRSASRDDTSFKSSDSIGTTSKRFQLGRKKRNKSSLEPPLHQHDLDVSYAQALQNGQGFFQRARIMSISARHGFPPSKDATGDNNRVHQFYIGKNFNTMRLVNTMRGKPVDGILPSGWVEKHAHALPSVILVVVQVTCDQTQFTHDENLMNTLENLRYSLAPKRQCPVHIVGLVQEGVTNVLAEQWSANVSKKVQNGETIMLLHNRDLQQDAPPSIALQYLHSFTRQASYQYYSRQASRIKQKLAKLGPSRFSPILLPLSIRYCFKIALFHEFQWQEQKSIKFMLEAYRNADLYYRYLLHRKQHKQRTGEDLFQKQQQASSAAPPSLMDKVSMSQDSMSTGGGDLEMEGIELALESGITQVRRELTEEEINFLKSYPPPEDMLHQCRKIADWINFKILQSGLTSHVEGGLLAVAKQWQKHSAAFCSPRRSFVSVSLGGPGAWMDWAYVAHQRMVVSQLLERHPPKAIDGTNREMDEILFRCSPWRTYEATAEAILRLGAEIRLIQEKGELFEENVPQDSMRQKFVGGLDTDGHLPTLEEESKINHREVALACIERALSLLQRQVNSSPNLTWKRSAARLEYLAGGTLLGLGRHQEAIPHLTTAATLCDGWPGLEVTIRRMLIRCYEQHIPSQGDDEKKLASALLDTYFNAQMTNADLRKALVRYSELSGGGSVEWYRDCNDEADSTLPFSFFLSFPSITHAFAGDKVKARLMLKSNLDYAVQVDSVTLKSLAGSVSIPSTDLQCAKNADQGSGRGIIMQAKAEILLSTEIQLPKDINDIAIDETGNGGEKEGSAGKGSFSKTARPRTGGISSGAGARLVEEDVNADKKGGQSSGQWSLRCLGGRPLRCDGLKIDFYPVQSATGDGKNTVVELTIEKKYARTDANIKRTPFEEDNYLASAWRRPKLAPMAWGPRCLRVLSPMADMVITNLTEQKTNGKAMEGAVNRVLLKFKAGEFERCMGVKVKISCSSFLVSPEGKVRRIVGSQEAGSDESCLSKENPNVRTPTLVKKQEGLPPQPADVGYTLPEGWGGNESSDFVSIAPQLNGGESAFTYFDLYRPLPPISRAQFVLSEGSDGDEFSFDQDMCQTDVDVTVSYRQERPSQKGNQPLRRRGRRKPDEVQASEEELTEVEDDIVTLEYNARVQWAAPISAVFKLGLNDSHPCGNRHPSNLLPDPNATSPRHHESSDIVALHGERVGARCTLEAVAADDSLVPNIEEVRFKNDEGEHPCEFKLLTGKDESGLLYKGEDGDSCRELLPGTTFAFSWTALAEVNPRYQQIPTSSSLGVISVGWNPAPLTLPDDYVTSDSSEPISEHGPLPLKTPPTCRFIGPPCYIEKAPFAVKMNRLQSSPKVGSPFSISYQIKNMTPQHQALKVSFKGSIADREAQGYMLSGLVDGTVALGAFEIHNLCYTVIATRAGAIQMPRVCVSSDRFGTWVIKETLTDRKELFIVP